MADIEARREARRKKILQSTEDRMNRVLGRQHENPTATDNVNLPQNDSTGPMKDDVEQETTLRQRNIVNKDSDESNKSSNSTAAKSTVKVSPLRRPQTLQNQSDLNDSLNTSKSTAEAKMMLKHFEFLRIVLCFMTAFLCRKVLVSGYGIFYVQSVMLPFMCLEAGFFVFKKKMLHNVILPHRSSMLIGVLMLCGIKPSILQLYNKIMGYITAASEDFAMFFFAFMFANCFVS